MRQECKQLKQMIVEIDELTEFNELSDELQQLITEGCIQWPQGLRRFYHWNSLPC